MAHAPGTEETSARDGWVVFVLSLALWGVLLGGTLLIGHELANRMFAAHH